MTAKNKTNERDKIIDATVANIEKAFGQGSIMKMNESSHMNVEVIPTGSISLDMATGVGGVPMGRVIEIFGPEASGKTTLALHIVAECQKKGGKAAYIDAEHALDPVYAKNLGVNIDDLLVSQPDTGEQGLEICDMLASSGAIDAIVIDSVAALVPKAEIQGEMGDSHVGLQARLMSQALRKLTGTLQRTNTCVLFINQLREKVGIMFGNPEVTTGGHALKYYSSMRFDVRRVETIKKGDEMIGSRTRVKVVKNKVSPPFKKAEFDIMYGKGISIEGDILDSAVENGLVSKSGSWYSYEGERIGQGRETVKQLLEKDKALLNEIKDRLVDKLEPKEQNEPEDANPASQNKHSSGSSDKDELNVDQDGVIIE